MTFLNVLAAGWRKASEIGSLVIGLVCPNGNLKKSINFKVLQAEEYEEEVECLSF